MKMIKTGSLAIALCALVTLALSEELYSDKYDYIDIDNVLANSRIRDQYYNCFMETSPCLTPDAKFFKEKLPEAMVTKCRKCTDKQKEMFEKVVVYYTENEKEKWDLILRKAIQDHQKHNH